MGDTHEGMDVCLLGAAGEDGRGEGDLCLRFHQENSRRCLMPCLGTSLRRKRGSLLTGNTTFGIPQAYCSFLSSEARGEGKQGRYCEQGQTERASGTHSLYLRGTNSQNSCWGWGERCKPLVRNVPFNPQGNRDKT